VRPITPMLPANGLPWFCQSFHGHCSPFFFCWTPHSEELNLILLLRPIHQHVSDILVECHMNSTISNGAAVATGKLHGPIVFCTSFEAITVWMPSSKASAWMGKPPKVENRRVYRRLYGEVYTVDGYLSDVCLYQYLERDQTKRERIKIKCKRKYAWLKVPLLLKKPAKQWHMVV